MRLSQPQGQWLQVVVYFSALFWRDSFLSASEVLRLAIVELERGAEDSEPDESSQGYRMLTVIGLGYSKPDDEAVTYNMDLL